MAYGRLDVFFPDGVMRSFPLAEANVSIGRSIGNTIVLDSETISRYHLAIARTDQGVFLTDLESQNGTFVDGVRIPHNQPLALRGGEEILIGELILIFRDVDDNPTRPIVVPEETQLAARVDQTYRIELEQPDIAVPPGAYTSAKLTIVNLIETPQRFAITAGGLPREWLRVMPSQVEVGPEASTEVAISIKPLRRPDSRPGDYRLEVSVTPLDLDAEEADQRRLTVHTPIRILPFGGFGLVLEPRRIRPGDPIRLHMHNQGSAELSIRLAARRVLEADERDERSNGVVVTFSPPQVRFAPGQRLTVTGAARPVRTPLFGDPRVLAFDVIARSGDAAAYTIAQRAYLLVKPLLPRWSAYALLGLAIALAALLGIALIGLLDRAASPVIVRFNVRDAVIEQGTPIEVEWETHNTRSIALLIDDLLVADDIDPASGYAQISSSAISGRLNLILQARSGDRVAEAGTVVEVLAPLALDSFTVEPTPLVRYVAQVITLRWRVSGAVTSAISGLERLTTAPTTGVFTSQGEIVFNAIPTQSAYTLTVNAAAEDGRTFRQDVTITTIDPECTAGVDLNLRASPDPAGRIISTVPAGARVVVDARDISGTWLRVHGGRGWGETARFLCDPTFNPQDLLQELAIATLVPLTPTPAEPAPPTLPPPTPAQGTISRPSLSAESARPQTGQTPPPVIIATATPSG
jgi:hypothetical protein